MAEKETQPALELVGIGKRYGDRAVNHDVGLRILRGEVHAVVGENGAGKSTLLSIAYGETRADEGRIVVGGTEVSRGAWSPAAAISRGLGMVHQHERLVPTLTVAENVVLGREGGWRVDLARAERELAALGERVGLKVEAGRRVEELSVGERQRVELLKILWRGADVLLLDEPTAVLSPPEVDELFAVLGRLVAEGKSVVLVTHKLDEVARVAARVTVLRQGQVVAELPGSTDPREIARAMVGGKEIATVHRPAAPAGNERLRVEGLTVRRADGAEAVRGVDLAVRGGEILGIAGVHGNGQTELVLAIAGLVPAASGRVLLDGHAVDGRSAGERRALGLAHVPEDRHGRGLILPMTVQGNLLLGREREFTRVGLLQGRRIETFARERVAALDVRPPEPKALASSLSGGNQQKVVVARELAGAPRVLLCAEPTRGVDLAAAARLREAIRAAAENGAAVLLVSADRDELRELSHRIAVMYGGRIAGVMPVEEATDERLGQLMTGTDADGDADGDAGSEGSR